MELDDAQILWLEASALPADWNAYPHPESTQGLGDSWVRSGETLALAVPSVLASPEVNVMLNCEHPDFLRLTVRGPDLFPLDLRLTPDAR